jgi:hypothetical protein
MLAASDLITAIRRDVDETTAANSFWSDADIVAYINRVLTRVSNTLPVRTATFTITGDGSATEHLLDKNEYLSQWRGVLDGILTTPKIGYVRSLREQGTYGFLPFVFGDYGFGPVERAGRQSVRIVPTVPNGETRDVIAVSVLGKIKETPYSTGTVSITNDSATSMTIIM